MAHCHIIGVGASAGGLQALQNFLEQFPAAPDLAIAIVTHLSKGQKSYLASLLSAHCTMQVVSIENNMAVSSNMVYVMPAGMNLVLHSGHFKLHSPKDAASKHHPVDIFFKSLADECGPLAMGAILSGTGTDGAAGVAAIKQQGGFCLIQKDSEFTGMPDAASKVVEPDAILPTELMAQTFMKHLDKDNQRNERKTQLRQALQVDENSMEVILEAVLKASARDFREYKASTLRRRIQRRMTNLEICEPEQYAAYIQENNQEAEVLANDLLISVTSFFRDTDAYDLLAQNVIPQLHKGKTNEEQIRIWSAGCATGEEAYSISMLFHEHQRQTGGRWRIQIFATDADFEAIEFARRGVYPENSVAKVPSHLRNRYFQKTSNGWAVTAELRESVVFAIHNLLHDPPFHKLDMICCRNLLIYFETGVQEKIFPYFVEGLQEDGVLFLGPSENISGFKDYFTVLDKKWKLFKRNKNELDRSQTMLRSPKKFVMDKSHDAATTSTPKSADSIEHRLASLFTGVLINPDDQVISIFGDPDPYLAFSSGTCFSNIHSCARPYLRAHLRIAIAEARSGVDFKLRNIATPNGAHVDIRVSQDDANPQSVLIIFESISNAQSASQIQEQDMELTDLNERLLEQLRLTGEELQETLSSRDYTGQELRAANEELVSMNEELQSSNEELEASQEELQAMNEELTTINTELQFKISELANLNSDMENLFSSTDIATIFLDTERRIRRFTPKASKIYHLREGDQGRPLADLGSSLIGDATLLEDCNAVLSGTKHIERVMQTNDEQTFQVEVTPYKSERSEMDGVVVTFVDITQLKHTEAELRQSHEKLKQLVNERTAALQQSEERFSNFFYATASFSVISDIETGRYIDVNDAFCEMSGYSREEIIDKTPIEIGLITAEQRKLFIGALSASGKASNIEILVNTKSGDIKNTIWSTQAIEMSGKKMLMSTGLDLTDKVRAESQARNLAKFPEENPHPVMRFDKDGQLLFANSASSKLQHFWKQADGQELPPDMRELITETLESGQLQQFEIDLPDCTYHISLASIREGAYVNLYALDVTLRKKAEMEMLRTTQRLQALASLAQMQENSDKEIASFILGEISSLTDSAFGFIGTMTKDGTVVDTLGMTENIMNECGVSDKSLSFHVSKGGVWAEAIRRKEPLIFNDFPNAPERRGFPKGHIQLSRVMVVPIIEGGEVVFLGLFANKAAAYDQMDILQVTVLLDATWHTLRRRKLNQSLRDSRADLKRAQQVARIGNWRLTVQDNTFEWSDEIYHIFNIPHGTTMTYDSFLECVHPEDQEMVDNAWQAALNGAPYDIEHRIISSKEERWIRELGSLEFNADGQLVSGFGTTQDITDRKRTEEELRRALEELSLRSRELDAVLSSVQDYICIFNRDGLFAFANQRLLDLWGLSADQAIGKTMKELDYPPEVEAKLLEGVEHVFTTGKSIANETRYVSPVTGEHGVYENIFSPMLSSAGNVGYIACASRDITDRKRAEQQQEERIRERSLLADTARKLSLAGDLETVSVIVSTAARELTEADGATFVMRNGDFCHYVDEDSRQPLWKGRQFPMDTCLCGWVISHGQSAIIEDITTDPRIPQEFYADTFIKSLVMVPKPCWCNRYLLGRKASP